MPSNGSTHVLSRSEYESACRAEHGNVRRFLSGCRCPRCDRAPNYRFLCHLPRVNRTRR